MFMCVYVVCECMCVCVFRGSDLAVGGVAEQFSLGVLHGAGDGAVHQPGHPQLRNT